MMDSISSASTSLSVDAFMHRFQLFQTGKRFLLSRARNQNESIHQVIEIVNAEPGGKQPVFRIVPGSYSLDDLRKLVQETGQSDSGDGHTRSRLKAHAFLGLVQLLDGWYLHFLVEQKHVGCIAGSNVFVGKAAKMVRVSLRKDVDVETAKRYRSLFESISVSNFYYSSDRIDLTRPLQETSTKSHSSFDSMFCWNFLHASKAISAGAPSHWMVALLHGTFLQRSVQLSDGQRWVTISVICRRSRWFAGTRFNRRGIDRHGHVANEVESEFVVSLGKQWDAEPCAFASVRLYRGSIPLYWGHPPNQTAQPKPKIILTCRELDFNTTFKHFYQLKTRYGRPIVCFNLIKQFEKTPHETILGAQFQYAISEMLKSDSFNSESLKYVTFDFLKYQGDHGDVSEAVHKLIAKPVKDIGFFALDNLQGKGRPTRLQNGVIRVNCIDCLDRTNFAQYCISKASLHHQLVHLGIASTGAEGEFPNLENAMKEIFMIHGDKIANQYAGSGAMHKHQFASGNYEDNCTPEEYQPKQKTAASVVAVKGRIKDVFGQIKKTAITAIQNDNALTAIRRYYSNAVTDAAKQHAINVFIGHFVPSSNQPDIWDLPETATFDEPEAEKELRFAYPWSLEHSSTTEVAGLDDVLFFDSTSAESPPKVDEKANDGPAQQEDLLDLGFLGLS